jgi:hypothetical protein
MSPPGVEGQLAEVIAAATWQLRPDRMYLVGAL